MGRDTIMTTFLRRTTTLPRVPLAVLGLSIALVIGPRIAGWASAPTAPRAMPPAVVVEAGDAGQAIADPLTAPVIDASTDDIARIRANVAFWGDRLAANPRDFVSATRVAGSFIELARATGDIGAYAAADEALERALTIAPDSAAARGYRGVVLVALHRFVEARDHAAAVLVDQPGDPTALATLGDAALELGDLTMATDAYTALRALAPSAAAEVRESRLAFIQGRVTDAVAASRAAVDLAVDEGASGALAWYRYQLGALLLATGDRAGASEAFDTALRDDPTSHLALAGRARIAAAEGSLDAAIADLDAATATIPLPESLARRADLLERRGGPGDAARAADDRATVLAIAQLSDAGAGVYDRTLALYLATTGIDPQRALRLAEAEIAVRKDVYGYDALGWALLANGRDAEADAALTAALAVGTRDASILYHAGMAASAVGDAPRARQLLEDALALDPTFDPVSVARAEQTLVGLR